MVASPGVPVFELAIAMEVFGVDRRDLTPGWYEFAIAGLRPRSVTIGHGLTVPAGTGLEALRGADTVIVPACDDLQADVPGRLLGELCDAHDRGARIAAICSGAFVLAAAGLLDGRRATTHWMHAAEMGRRYPRVEVDPMVLYVHDDVWTSAGSAAGLDMCLELVRQDHGAAVANEVARRIVTPPHRDGGQAQYIRLDRSRVAMSGRDVQEWARRHLREATVAGMAAYACVSQRTLNRRFHERAGTSAQTWLQRVRLDAAAEQLETTDLTIDVIAERVGLGSAANMRIRFADAYGVPPGQYRRTFAVGDTSLPAIR